LEIILEGITMSEGVWKFTVIFEGVQQ
jgi:hypothetical protein